MSSTDQTCLLFVQMTVKHEEEGAFNRWYEDDHTPAFVRDVRDITRCHPFVTLSANADSVSMYPDDTTSRTRRGFITASMA